MFEKKTAHFHATYTDCDVIDIIIVEEMVYLLNSEPAQTLIILQYIE
jgi:hypothetical protein